MSSNPPQNGPSRSWLDALLVYTQRPVLSMLFLGFSAGLPFYLIFQTLSAWLRQEGIDRSTIGMLAWVGLFFTVKFLWAPIVDRVPLPFLHRLLGRRRSWMLLAQAGIAVALFNLSLSEPSSGVTSIALWAMFLAFCAATQDISLDAWRIESATLDMQGAMAAAYQIGYRVALITGSAGALWFAGDFGWHTSYQIMALLAGVGILTTLLVREPQGTGRRDSVESEARVVSWLEKRAHWPRWLRTGGAWLIGAVVCPLSDFVARFGIALAVLLIGFIGTYRLTDFTMGVMTNSFYIDKGYTLAQIAAVVKAYGLAMSIIGVLVGGVLIAKIGLLRCLVLGSILVILSNLGFATLATQPPTLLGLGLVNAFDNLALAIHGTSLIAFLSSLTSAKYTATQYALLSSFYALPPKILEGFSGFVVDAVGYPLFFIYTASLSIPALVLLLVLYRVRPDIARAA